MKISPHIKLEKLIFIGVLIVALIASSGCTDNTTSSEDANSTVQADSEGITTGADESVESTEITITDGFGREVTIPSNVESVVCSGAGCLRYLVYLQAQDLIVGVDSLETKESEIEGRPYTLANPQLKDYPLIGEFRGNDDPEKIIAIGPQIILKTDSNDPATAAATADELQEKTGIPVIAFPYGSTRSEEDKADMYSSIRLMGEVVGKEERAEEVISYFEAIMEDLDNRTADISESEQKTVYVGGVSSAGAHGIISTEPAYAPFLWVHANNVASGIGVDHADVSKEKLVEWDPEYIFVDVGTIQLGDGGAINELKTDPSLAGLSAVENGNVYGVVPYNYYTTNHESVLSNAYFVGKVLYPDQFEDIDPETKAEEIFTFFVGKPVFSDLNAQYDDLGFTQLSL
ncbi:Iron(III) dicitrate-binding protein [Methanosarcina siciliae T4/M]|uniref:Iron(III) dicitrate-binding protein n=2 Tax=Methanosarcina siciliae TaxID=38027 RepID=A0A0E3PBM2_9EURY|nr:iron ABC transporter substrate-binding protein [Methanosarcina siciliae]AKB27562.1 Iron(III) dicitrate-binding protein [Methanosarcina siciliae T4/M]AKB31504.1 Iron(III) dicitrate-binding protein [Methanosarcina siciliae HI350]